jgi:PAS domain S-box-containing protein
MSSFGHDASIDDPLDPTAFTLDDDVLGRRARALFDAIDDAIFVHDLDGHILDANPAACRRLGYTREEFLRLSTRDIDDPEFAAGYAERLQTQMETGSLNCEGRHRTKDGRVIPVDINTSSMQFDGQPAVLAVMRDLSERKLAERRRNTVFAVTRILAESPRVRDATPPLVRAIGEGIGWEYGVIWTVDRRANVLRCAAQWHAADFLAVDLQERTRTITYSEGEGVPGRVWATANAAWEVDLALEPGCRHAVAALDAGMKQAFAVPITLGLEILGVIEYFTDARLPPDHDLRQMLSLIVSHIGQFITRRRVEADLGKFEAFYHALVESLPQNIFRKDSDGVFTFANQRFCNILGRKLDEVVGKTDYDFFPYDLAEKYRRDDAQVMRTGKNIELVEEHCTPQGEKLFVEVIKTPVFDLDGKVIGTQCFFWDVTQKHRAEEALQESERRYRQLTEAALDAIIVADQRGDIRLFNKAAERAFGYEAAEVLGAPLTLLMPHEFQPLHDRGLRRYVDTRKPRVVGRTVEMRGRRKDGTEFPLELSLNAIDVGGELQFLGAIRDLSERNKMRAMLNQNEKLASIGLLSAGVAHEINNPLAYVANNLVVLERDNKALMQLVNLYESGRQQLTQTAPSLTREIETLAERIDLSYVRDNLDRVLTRTRLGVERVTKIVQSLRGLARTSAPQMEDAYLPDIIDMGLDMIRGQLQRRGVKIEQNYKDLPKVHCVTTQIGQVVLNILVNAMQAIESAGRSEGLIRITAWTTAEELIAEFSDNGTGIDKENMSKLFDPFFTTKPVGEGTGLGLSISHNIITGHGGRIEVESQVGVGTTFRITLPLEPARGRS